MSKDDHHDAVFPFSSPAKRVYVKPRLVEIDLEAPTDGKTILYGVEYTGPGGTFGPS